MKNNANKTAYREKCNEKPNAIYSGACATVNTDFVFAAVQGEEFILGSSNKERKKQQKIKNIVRETFRMELSQHRSSSAQSSDYMVCFRAAISLHEYSILENGTVLKDFSASTSFFFCFFFQAPDLLFPHKKGKAVSESEKKNCCPCSLPNTDFSISPSTRYFTRVLHNGEAL